MKTNQPIWKLVAQLGDVHPIEYGGYFIYVDETGVYPPEAELLELYEAPGEPGHEFWQVHRFIIEPCTYINGVLSDNRYHPDKSAWFAGTEEERKERPQDTTYLKDIAGFIGAEVEQLVELFTSEKPEERAVAWRAVGEYHGFDNLDSYPLTLTRAEVEVRYAEELLGKQTTKETSHE